MPSIKTASPLPRSERLEFRRWRPEDGELACSLWGDPKVMRYLGGSYSPEQAAARLAREIATDHSAGIQYWPIFHAATGIHVGCCGLRPHDPAARTYELGFHLVPYFWGGGYATEAARAVIRFAFDELHATALFAGHHPENEASRRLLTNLGFVQAGTHFYEPTHLDHPWYELTAGRYLMEKPSFPG